MSMEPEKKTKLLVYTTEDERPRINLQLTEVPTATLTDVIVSKSATMTDTICHTSVEGLDLIRGGTLLAPALATMQEMTFGRDTTLRRLLPQIPDTAVRPGDRQPRHPGAGHLHDRRGDRHRSGPGDDCESGLQLVFRVWPAGRNPPCNGKLCFL